MSFFNRWIRRGVEKGVKEATDNFIESRLPALIEQVLREPRYEWFRFVKCIQAIISKACPTLTSEQSFKLAMQSYRDFLADEGIEFGDKRYTWGVDAARAIAEEYQISFWEPSA